MSVPSTLGLGAFCLGFLIGWLVYFMNRHRKGDVTLADLGVLIGIFAGGGVAGLLGGEPGKPLDPDAAGAYCIGLLVGFLSYLALMIGIVRRHGDQFDMLYFIDGRKMVPKSGYDFSVPARPLSVAAALPTTADEIAMAKLIDQAIADIDICLARLNAALAVETDVQAGDAIEEEKNRLVVLKARLQSLRTRLDFSRPDVIAAIAALTDIGGDLTTEAERMKTTTAVIKKAADVIGVANTFVDTIAKITK